MDEFGGSPRLQGLGGAVLEGGAAHFFLAGHVLRSEFVDPVEKIALFGEVGLGFLQPRSEHGDLRFPRSDRRARFARIDAEERIALLHLVADFDGDLLDHAVDQRGDVHIFPEGLDDAAGANRRLVRRGSGFHEGRGDRIGLLQTRDEEKHGGHSEDCGGDGDVSKHGSWVVDADEDGRGGNPTRFGMR